MREKRREEKRRREEDVNVVYERSLSQTEYDRLHEIPESSPVKNVLLDALVFT